MQTISEEQATRQLWDLVIVGAGLSGSALAHQMAIRGHRVLLVEKETFPRYKVCGCCLNARAFRLLQDFGLSHLLPTASDATLNSIRVMMPRRSITLLISEGRAISREKLDTALVAEAIKAGAHFIEGCPVRKVSSNADHATVQTSREEFTAPVVVLAAGIGARLCTDIPTTVASASRIGAGVAFRLPNSRVDPQRIYMGIGQGGYVGLVRLEDGRLNIGAALDPDFVRLHGGIGAAAQAIASSLEKFPLHTLPEEGWKGTPSLTQRPTRHAHGRVFLVGDAGGYIEPFTGEGMAWALQSAWDVFPFAERVLRGTNAASVAAHWNRFQKRRLALRRLPCRATSALVRHPQLMRAGFSLVENWPQAARPVISFLSARQVMPR